MLILLFKKPTLLLDGQLQPQPELLSRLNGVALGY